MKNIDKTRSFGAPAVISGTVGREGGCRPCFWAGVNRSSMAVASVPRLSHRRAVLASEVLPWLSSHDGDSGKGKRTTKSRAGKAADARASRCQGSHAPSRYEMSTPPAMNSAGSDPRIPRILA